MAKPYPNKQCAWCTSSNVLYAGMAGTAQPGVFETVYACADCGKSWTERTTKPPPIPDMLDPDPIDPFIDWVSQQDTDGELKHKLLSSFEQRHKFYADYSISQYAREVFPRVWSEYTGGP